MFNKKLKQEIERVDEYYRTELRNLNVQETVECEKCGCLLKKETAIIFDRFVDVHQEKVMEWKLSETAFVPGHKITIPAQIIREYYCKIHKPKKK